MPHALVTGATGGLGQTLVPALLTAGYTVTATGRNPEKGDGLVERGARFLMADLVTDELAELVADVDTVFHLAALSKPWGPLASFQAINVTATKRLLEAAQAAGVTRFIYASTPSIFAERRDRLGLTEASPPAATFANSYAATKYAAEQMVLSANRPGFQTVALRPRAIVGPDDTVLLPRLLLAGRRGVLPIPEGGRALIELTDVRDVAAAFIASDRAGHAAAGRVFNISGGQPRTLAYLLNTIFDELDRPLKIISIGLWLSDAMGHVGEAIASLLPGKPEPPVTRYTDRTLGYSQTFDLTAAREVLGWVPRYSPEEAIAWGLMERRPDA